MFVTDDSVGDCRFKCVESLNVYAVLFVSLLSNFSVLFAVVLADRIVYVYVVCVCVDSCVPKNIIHIKFAVLGNHFVDAESAQFLELFDVQVKMSVSALGQNTVLQKKLIVEGYYTEIFRTALVSADSFKMSVLFLVSLGKPVLFIVKQAVRFFFV